VLEAREAPADPFGLAQAPLLGPSMLLVTPVNALGQSLSGDQGLPTQLDATATTPTQAPNQTTTTDAALGGVSRDAASAAAGK